MNGNAFYPSAGTLPLPLQLQPYESRVGLIPPLQQPRMSPPPPPLEFTSYAMLPGSSGFAATPPPLMGRPIVGGKPWQPQMPLQQQQLWVVSPYMAPTPREPPPPPPQQQQQRRTLQYERRSAAAMPNIGPGRECRFCKNNLESTRQYRSHILRNPATNQLVCPVLREHVCEACGATGDDAHTKNYCPKLKFQLRQTLQHE